MIKNFMELAVDRVMNKILHELNLVCTCERCQMDIKAIALNNLTPHYVVSGVGEIFAEVNQLYIQHETNIIAELASASALVGKHPRHNNHE
jgi:competence protein ComFB